MKKTSKKLIVTLGLIIASAACVVGSTLALLFAEGEIGTVNVTGAAPITITNVSFGEVKTYKSVLTEYQSQEALEAAQLKYSGHVTDCVVDAFNGFYKYEPVANALMENGDYTFGHGLGCAHIEPKTEETGLELELSCVAPGDRIDFTATATIKSDVDVKYGIQVTGASADDKADETKIAHYVQYTPDADTEFAFKACDTDTGFVSVSINCSVYIPITASFDNIATNTMSIVFDIVAVQA